ncbi:MAG TPA: HAD family hydrolase [Bryobacteraceae bacterium]|nr:HAD family hydrolase [Bryobacteraceae bacterium]
MESSHLSSRTTQLRVTACMRKWAKVIEIIRPGASAAQAKVVIFDFDGTLSLIRSGWMDVMVPMCVEELAATGTAESKEELTATVEEFVWRLTGKETIYQMMALADAVSARGATPCEPRVYKKRYLDSLTLRIGDRLADLREKRVDPVRYLVPGSRKLLERLVSRGLTLYLASGTDHANVKEEAELLDVAHFFGPRIFGAQDDLKSFSKAILVQRILSQASFRPAELLVFGDGYVEVEEVKKAGGTAVGVATAEPDCLTIDDWKRQRLIQVGADFVVPNYVNLDELDRVVLGGRECVEPVVASVS